MPRLFIGIPLPGELKSRFSSLTKSLGQRLQSKVKWTQAENAHLTLKFLGQVDSNQVGEIRQALSQVHADTFALAVGECGCFPNMRKPRVLWLGVSEGGEECVQLAAMVDEVMAGIGFEREKREFLSHLTLGRVKRLEQDQWLDVLGDVEIDWPLIFMDRFVLWESELTSQGPIYTVVEEYFFEERGSRLAASDEEAG